MPTRLVSNGIRGWDRESMVVSTQKMSRKSLLSTRVKNQHESNRLRRRVVQIGKNMDKEDVRYKKDIEKTQSELRRIVASCKVYKEHSFENYDPFLRQKSARRDVSKIPGYIDDRYWKEKEGKSNVEKPEFPSGKRRWAVVVLKSSKPVSIKDQTGTVENDKDNRLATNIFKHKISAVLNKPSHSKHQTGVTKKISAQEFFEKFLQNASTQSNMSKPVPRIRRREKTFTYMRDRTIFAGQCKTTWEMRKFMEREVTEAVFSLSPEGKRKANIDMLKEKARLPSFVERSKSTAAILDDFKAYRQASEFKETVI